MRLTTLAIKNLKPKDKLYLDADSGGLTLAAMNLLALTFVRTGELIGARWEEIHFDRAEWHIPKERMKMKRPHIVPLSRQALTILASLKPLTGDKEHIFHSSRGKNRHISNGAVLMAL